MKFLSFIFIFFPITIWSQASSIQKEDLTKCEIQKQSRLEIRLGASDRFISSPVAQEFTTSYGFSPSIHLTLPLRFNNENYLFTKLIFGGSLNNVAFMDKSPGYQDRIPVLSTGEIYSNIYAGLGFGKHFIKVFKNNKSFLRIPLSLNVIYFPSVEEFGVDGFQPLMDLEYQFDIESNIGDKTNFSLVPEIAVEYHFVLNGCRSYSFGLYYSRGINIAHEGFVAIQRANGEEISQTYSKPFNSYGVSFSYGIFRAKKIK